MIDFLHYFDSEENIESFTFRELMRYIDDKKKRRCSEDDKVIYDIPYSVHRLNLHSMKDFLMYCGMSNGSRIDTEQFQNVNHLLQNLENTFQSIEGQYSMMKETEKNDFILYQSPKGCQKLFQHVHEYFKLSQTLQQYIDELRIDSLKYLFSETQPIVPKKSLVTKPSPIQELVSAFKKECKKPTIENFADYLCHLYEERYEYGIPMEYRMKNAFSFIVAATEKSYRFNLKLKKQRKECFLEFLSTEDEIKRWH